MRAIPNILIRDTLSNWMTQNPVALQRQSGWRATAAARR